MAVDQDAAMREAAQAVAAARLSDAFGHVSLRATPEVFIITPAQPLGRLAATDSLIEVELAGSDLPVGAPKEAWIHRMLLRSRPEVRGVCRAQPPAVAAATALNRPLALLNGHAALMGPIATYPDSRLIRDADSGAAMAESAGAADIVILRGNGAVTLGVDLAQAVARMWLLERAAELSLRAWAAGSAINISTEEQQWWRARSDELLPRIYDYLRNPSGEDL